jgi:secreted trypsin-like serine protease
MKNERWRWLSVGLLLMAACTVNGPIETETATQTEQRPTAAPIKGGSPAYDYPEAVFMNKKGQGFCSGSLIAPTLVLTAGHCVANFQQVEVVAPYASPPQTATGYKAAVFDYTDTSDSVNPNQHDVGVVFLSQPIQLSHYLQLDPQAVTIGQTKAHNIGRINNGQLSYTDVFVGPLVKLLDGSDIGYPFAYHSNDITESGDSGGPVVIPSAPPRNVVAVCSGGGKGTQIMARLDLVHDWLQQQLAEAGGGGSGAGGSGASSTGVGGSSSVTATGVGGSGPSASSVSVGTSAASGCNSCSGGGTTACHDVCVEGPPMSPGCEPCVGTVCYFDPYCCHVAWDTQCVDESHYACGACGP